MSLAGRTISHDRVIEEIERGDRARAREHYARFLKYWQNGGDIDRDKVTEALKRVQ